jgi:hypothetical protein
MSENISQVPIPPTLFSETGIVNPSSQDALGVNLLRKQGDLIHAATAAGNGQFAQEYWADMQEFHELGRADTEELVLQEAAEKYNFSPASREYINQRDLGYYTLRLAFDSDGWKTDSGQTWEQHYKKDLDEGIQDLRKELGTTLSDPYNSMALGLYMGLNAPPIFEHMRTAPDGQQYKWSEWLTDKATPEQFMNFLQWHNHYMIETNNDPKVQAGIETEKSEYKSTLDKFIADGELPVGAAKEREIDYCKVYVGDTFGTLMKGWVGYYPRKDNPSIRYVIVGEYDIEEATKHELNHAVIAGFKDRWLDEAATEHLAVSMKNGRVDLVHDLIDQGTYNEERELLDVVMNWGTEVISTKTLLWGYAEHKSPVLRNEFQKAVDKIWGYRALDKIQASLDVYESQLVSEGESVRDAQKGALMLVRSDLLQQPETIFEETYATDGFGLKVVNNDRP